MKPNFALDLTFDGLALLHRAGDAGWHVVGEVPLDSPFLTGDLAALRKKANTLDPAGMRTKLVIPDEQIRYLDIPAASAPHGDHDAAAEAALDGATPYALADLAYDWTVSGERLYIAAVARETLDEAESFAREHKFNPVCFVADPDADRYAGEPFFGMTEDAGATDMIERDTGPMKRLGALPDPDSQETAAATSDETGKDKVAFSFASVRAERGLPPKAAPRLEGVARITPSPLPDAEARALSGAAQASLAPRDDAPPVAAATGKAPSPKAPTKAAKAPKAPPAAPPETAVVADRAPPAPAEGPASGKTGAASGAAAPTPTDEADRLTIFGARSKSDARRGKPRFLGLILTAVLLLVLIGVAAWAAIFPESGLSRLLRGSEPQIAVTPDIPELASPEQPSSTADTEVDIPEAGSETPEAAPPDDPPEIAALPDATEPVDTPDAPDTAGQDAPEATDGWTEPRTPEEARTRYAATGIWPSAPEAPDEPRTGSLDTFYQTSIDEPLNFGDAIALPQARSLGPDPVPSRPGLPPPPGRTFALDERGFVQATPDGALTPEGVRVIAGPPPVRPPQTPARAVPLPGLTPTDEAAEARENLSGIRPRARPETLIEEHERGAFGGRTRTELATLRPRTRPEAITGRADAAAANAVAAAVAAATDEAVAESLKPRLRPATVARTTTRSEEPARAPATAPAPAIPTSASIAQRATERNAINLRQLNLIGVYGTTSNRRALVRLANGRYRKLQVGDRIDGGQVSAIGDMELRYTKSGRSVVLRIPKG